MRSDRFRHPPGRDHDRVLLTRPFLLDPADYPVNRVHRPIENAGPDAFVRAARDHLPGRDNVSCRKLRRAPEQRVSRDHDPGLNDAPEEGPISGDAVVGRGGPQIDDDSILPVNPAGGEGVRDPIGADRKWLFHIELDRELCAGVDHDRLAAKAHLARFGEHRGDGWDDRANC